MNAAIWIWAMACQDPDKASQNVNLDQELGVLDMTLDLADPPEGGYQFASPEIVVDPYSEVNLCYYGTYEGPTVGVNFMTPFAPDGITHHASLMAIYDDEYEDGELIDCLAQGENNMPIYSPLFEAVGLDTVGGEPFETDPFGGLNWIDVPEGVAFKLETGQRWALDLHYINTTEQTALVNTGFNVGTVPEEEVEHWASTLQFDAGLIDLEPGSSWESFQCPWEDDFTVLSIMGHMHDFGSYYGVDWNKLDGTDELVYSVDEWTADHKDYPKITYYEPGDIVVQQGEEFTTHCEWFNPTDEVLPNPAEMCTTVIVAYPMEKPLTCIRGEYIDY